MKAGMVDPREIEDKAGTMAGELVMLCFHARTTAHILHLQTKSYAEHKALNEFYDAIVDLADSFAETYQGEYGIITAYPMKYKAAKDGQGLMEEMADWIENNRYSVCDSDDSHLQNIIDEMVALIRSTEYKLKFLK